MQTLHVRSAVPTRADTTRTLALIEAQRYARHPGFLIGAALLALLMVSTGTQGSAAYIGDTTVAPAACLGLLGVFVGFRLTRSMTRTRDVVEASPADALTRTAALCLACLVSGTAALGWLAVMWLEIVLVPLPGSPAISTAERTGILLTGVVYSVGGPLIGVMVGRWTRFPGAALVASIGLVTWTLVTGGASEGMAASRLSALVQLHAPYTTWLGGTLQRPWVVSGSPQWYLVYITLLCALAATAALLHEAAGAQRSRLMRVLGVLSALAVVSLGLAVAPDPTRVPL